MATMTKKRLSVDSTIYHYTLLQRIHYNPRLLALYWIFPAGLWIWDLFRLRLWLVPFSFALVVLLHAALLYVLQKVKERRSLNGWKWHYRLPWLGWIAGGHIAMDRMLRLHWQLLGIALAIIGCFYPWIDRELIARLAIVHLWILAPRFWILFRMRAHRHVGYLKINESDTSCYAQ